MAYRNSVYIKAKEELERRRRKAEDELAERHAQVVAKCPELLDIERRMAAQGSQIVRAIGMGADAQEYIEKLSQANLEAQRNRRSIILAAGFPEDYLTAHYTCEKCKDSGTYDTYYCECYRKLVREIAFEELSKSSPLKLSSFDNFNLSYYPQERDDEGFSPREHMTRIFNFCRDYADDFSAASPSLVMYGKTGLGKTHLSLAIASVAVKRGYAVVYDSTQNIMNRLQKEHFSRVPSDEDTTELLETCDLLILDDLGAEFATQFTVAALYNIINTRMLKGLPVIISTNLDMKELEGKYTQRIASRIIGAFIPLYFCGKDIRQIMANGG